jgi:glutamyl-Q tRNA(Asp) synthetase
MNAVPHAGHSTPPAPAYVGRFAPSPTGPLHFGSLVAALGSCLEARCRAGRWLVRIEDVDRPRCSPIVAEDMLSTLAAFGFEIDGEVIWQSRREDAYVAALENLREQGDLFPCACTRRELADSQLAPDGAAIYRGTCRDGLPQGRAPRAWRLRVGDARVAISDAVQGDCEWHLARDCGDFVVRRADGLFAYQLAVVVDDAAAGVTHVVRGADILHSTPRQIALQTRLGLPQPAYGHLPVVTNAAGEKLSKQTLARAVDLQQAGPLLVAALRFLDQAPPDGLARAPLREIWDWALAHWDLARIQPGMGRPLIDAAV